MLRHLVKHHTRLGAFMMSPRMASGFTMVRTESPTHNKEFWNKNKELSRPMSPHVSIYQVQLTWTLSIFHRATGVGISALLYGGGIGALFATGVSFPEIVGAIQANVPQFLILTSKTLFACGMIFHTLNGVRHLIWDVGYGFQLKHLYLSGYVVVALTALGTVLVFIKG